MPAKKLFGDADDRVQQGRGDIIGIDLIPGQDQLVGTFRQLRRWKLRARDGVACVILELQVCLGILDFAFLDRTRDDLVEDRYRVGFVPAIRVAMRLATRGLRDTKLQGVVGRGHKARQQVLSIAEGGVAFERDVSREIRIPQQAQIVQSAIRQRPRATKVAQLHVVAVDILCAGVGQIHLQKAHIEVQAQLVQFHLVRLRTVVQRGIGVKALSDQDLG